MRLHQRLQASSCPSALRPAVTALLSPSSRPSCCPSCCARGAGAAPQRKARQNERSALSWQLTSWQQPRKAGTLAAVIDDNDEPRVLKYDCWVDVTYFSVDEESSSRASQSDNDEDLEWNASQEVNRSLNGAEEDGEEIPLDRILEEPELPKKPPKDDTPVPEFDAIAPLIPEKQRMFLKLHQKEGIAFMYKHIVEAPEAERGCILAHSMGLGKTFQAIVFTRVFFLLGMGNSALVIAPKSTLGTWEREFLMWTRSLGTRATPVTPEPNMKLFRPGEESSFHARQDMIDEWMNSGGVMVLSYQMFSSMVGESATEESAQMKYYRKAFTHSQTQPALLICDEGHKIKNAESLYAKALARIKTPNKIVLTGTPIQNNLGELYTILCFVRRQFMEREHFQRLYEQPILAGSRKDSTPAAVTRMKETTFALYRDVVDKYVHRRGQELLSAVLPPKYEFIIKVAPTAFQRKLYAKELHVGRIEDSATRGNLFALVDTLRKICNHTDLLLVPPSGSDQTVMHDYRNLLPDDYERFLLGEHGSKMQVLFDLLQQCFKSDEKVLLFSQWTATLNLIEALFATHEFEINDEPTIMQPGSHYYRLDGSTRRRQDVIDRFNNSRSPVRLFLISTLAGGLGISLTGASRAILYDVSWNPASDSQATCRCYRYGQSRPVYVYRLMQAGTVEESIWNRSCAKTWLSQRVVDQRAAERRLTKDDLLLFEPTGVELASMETLKDAAKIDSVLSALVEQYRVQPVVSPQITNITEHDSLFSEDRSDVLSERERSGLEQDLAYQRMLNEQRDASAGVPQPRVGPLLPARKNAAPRATPRGARLREIAQKYTADKANGRAGPASAAPAAAKQALANDMSITLAQKSAQLRFQELMRRRKEEQARAAQQESERVASVNSMLATKRTNSGLTSSDALPELFRLESGKKIAAMEVEKRRAANEVEIVREIVREVPHDPHGPPSVPPPPPSIGPPPPLRTSAAAVPTRVRAGFTGAPTPLRQSSGTIPHAVPLRTSATPGLSVARPSQPPVLDGVMTESSEHAPTEEELKIERGKADALRKQVFSLSFKRQFSDGVEPSGETQPPAKASVPPPPSVAAPSTTTALTKKARPESDAVAPQQPAAAPVAEAKKANAVAPSARVPAVTAPAAAAMKAPLGPQDQFKHLVAKYYSSKFAQLIGKMTHEELKQLNMQLTKQYVTSHVQSTFKEQLPLEDRAALKVLANRTLADKGLAIE